MIYRTHWLRPIIVFFAIIVPIALGPFGLTGSWSFTFPAVIVWCALVRPSAMRRLGFVDWRVGVVPSILAGGAVGIVLGAGCGEFLKLLGIAGIEPAKIEIRYLPAFGDALKKGFTGMHVATGDSPLKLAWYFIYYVFSVGLGEELFWRGLFQQELKRRTGWHLAVWMTGIAFGLVHVFLLFIVPFWPGVAFLVLITTGGVVWGYMFEVTRNIWGIAVSHGLTSAIIWKWYFFA